MSYQLSSLILHNVAVLLSSSAQTMCSCVSYMQNFRSYIKQRYPCSYPECLHLVDGFKITTI